MPVRLAVLLIAILLWLTTGYVVLPTEVGQALLQKHEAYVRRHGVDSVSVLWSLISALADLVWISFRLSIVDTRVLSLRTL